MKEKNNINENYINREELENIYNYQKKVFDSKIEDIHVILEKIQDCFSAKFGEDFGDNKFDKEICDIKKDIKNIQKKYDKEVEKLNKEVSGKGIDEKYQKAEELIKSKIENVSSIIGQVIANQEKKLKSLQKNQEKEITEFMQEIKNNEQVLKNENDKYLSLLDQRFEDVIVKQKDKAPIVRVEKKLKTIIDDRKEINTKIEQNVEMLNSKLRQLEKSLRMRIADLEYETTISKINVSIEGLQLDLKELEETEKNHYNENSKQINELERSLKEQIGNDIESLRSNVNGEINNLGEEYAKLENTFMNTVKELKAAIDELQDAQIEIQQENSDKCEKLGQNFEIKIENIEKDISNEIAGMQTLKSNLNEEITNLGEKATNLENKFTDTVNELKNILDKLQDEQIKTQQENDEKFDKIKNIENNFIQKFDSIIEENRICREGQNAENLGYKKNINSINEQMKNLSMKILKLEQNADNQLQKSQYENMQYLNERIEEVNPKKHIEDIKNQIMLLQNQMCQIDTIIGRDINKIVDQRVRTMQKEYDKVLNSRLKSFEKMIEMQQKYIEDKFSNENKQTQNKTTKTTRTTRKTESKTNNNIMTFDVPEPQIEHNSKIYNPIDVPVKEAAQSNRYSLDEAINTLKGFKNVNSNVVENNTKPKRSKKTQILNFFDEDI